MTKVQGAPEYRSFLLRLWRVSRQEPWRASLEPIGPGERHSFGDLEDLFTFLRTQTHSLTQSKPERINEGKRP